MFRRHHVLITKYTVATMYIAWGDEQGNINFLRLIIRKKTSFDSIFISWYNILEIVPDILKSQAISFSQFLYQLRRRKKNDCKILRIRSELSLRRRDGNPLKTYNFFRASRPFPLLLWVGEEEDLKIALFDVSNWGFVTSVTSVSSHSKPSIQHTWRDNGGNAYNYPQSRFFNCIATLLQKLKYNRDRSNTFFDSFILFLSPSLSLPVFICYLFFLFFMCFVGCHFYIVGEK